MKYLIYCLAGIGMLAACHRSGSDRADAGRLYTTEQLYQIKTWRNLDEALKQPVDSIIKLVYFKQNADEFPKEVLGFTNLNVLEVTYNSIRELPDGIQKLPYLQSLYLQQNQFSSFPESIMGIKNLQRLSLAGNQIQELPENLSSLHLLRELNLSGNRIRQLPASFFTTTSLEVANLSHNQIAHLDDALKQLTQLRKLYLNDNQFTEIPSVIRQMPNLQFVDISGNHIPREELIEFVKENPQLKIVI